MRTRINSIIYFRWIGLTFLTGLILLGCSELLARHIVAMRATQSEYNDKYLSLPETWSVEELAENVSFLVRNEFFRKKVSEPPSVVELRKLTNLPPDRYFDDLWSMVQFLSFMEQTTDLHRVLQAAINRRYFGVEPCKGDGCSLEDDYTVSDDNAGPLLDLIARTYLDRALLAFQKVAVPEGLQAVTDIQTLTQQISFSPTSSATATYNRILVIGAFLGRYDFKTYPNFRAADYESLDKAVREDGDETTGDTAIAAYISGLKQFRDRCFSKASVTFEQQIGKSNHKPLMELYSFMALRSLARPFVDLRYVSVASDGKLLVNDCGSLVDSSVLMSRFLSLEKQYRTNIKRKGLIGDSIFYKNQMPFSSVRDAEIREAVARLASKSKLVTIQTEPQQPIELAESKANPPASTAVQETKNDKAPPKSGLPIFQWPVRGKVIAGYGAKTNGKSNDGINLAVPEGTPVQASEDGVVAYSGSELKGYGNLVLLRHSNGYVTAYAHLGQLNCKRGDQIQRGQIIGLSGQSGEVASPQLHYEIRKGSSPVDPLQFLNGA